MSANGFNLCSAEVKIPQDFQTFLCNGSNKERLFELIETVWINNKEDMEEERVIFFARKSECIKITKNDVTVIDEL